MGWGRGRSPRVGLSLSHSLPPTLLSRTHHRAVVVAALDELDKVAARARGVLHIEFDRERPHGRAQGDARGAARGVGGGHGRWRGGNRGKRRGGPRVKRSVGCSSRGGENVARCRPTPKAALAGRRVCGGEGAAGAGGGTHSASAATRPHSTPGGSCGGLGSILRTRDVLQAPAPGRAAATLACRRPTRALRAVRAVVTVPSTPGSRIQAPVAGAGRRKGRCGAGMRARPRRPPTGRRPQRYIAD